MLRTNAAGVFACVLIQVVGVNGALLLVGKQAQFEIGSHSGATGPFPFEIEALSPMVSVTVCTLLACAPWRR
jgi:hypothetical protein